MSLAAVLSIVFAAALTAFIAVLGRIGRAMIELRDNQRDLRVALIGYDGKNGMRSEVARLRVAKHEHDAALNSLTGRVGLVELKVDRLEGK